MIRFFLLFCLTAAAALVAGEYIIDLPESGVDGRVVAIELSGENLRNLGGHVDWLRLHDAKGELIPWACQEKVNKGLAWVRAKMPVTIHEVRKPEDGKLEIEFSFQSEEPLGDDPELKFNTAKRNFEQTVEVVGIAKDGSEHLLLSDGFIFDRMDNIDARRLEVKFSRHGCQRFRLFLSASSIHRKSVRTAVSVTQESDGHESTTKQTVVEEQPFNLQSLELYCLEQREETGGLAWQELEVPFERIESEEGVSRYVVKPGVTPVRGIKFTFQDANFRRRVSVEKILPQGNRVVAKAEVSRLGLQSTGQLEQSELFFNDVDPGSLQVTFEDGDNPPLHLQKVLVRLPIYRLKFFVSAEQFPLRLSAEPNSATPKYDVASVLSLGGDGLNVQLLHLKEFTGDVVVPPKEPSGGVSRLMLYLGIAFAVVAMGIVLSMTARNMNE